MTQTPENKNVPSKPGFYWASTRLAWFHCILRVTGEAPFFRIEGWDFYDGIPFKDVYPHDVKKWGPFIAENSPEMSK